MTAAASGSAPREVFGDVRGPDRVLRTSWHPGERLVAFSVWSGRECLATFRLPTAEVPELVDVLVRGLATSGSPSGESLPRTGALEVATLPTPGVTADPPSAPPAARSSWRRVGGGLRRASVHALDRCTRGAGALRDRLDRPGPAGGP